MIVNKFLSNELDSDRFPNAPSPRSIVLKRFKADGIKLVFCKNPSCCGLSPTVSISYALMAFNEDDEYIYAVSVERTDLREMASLIGMSVKKLQEEEGVKGFFGEPHIVMYGDDRREDLGAYSGNIDDLIVNNLMEYALDSLDILSDPEEL